MAESTGDDLDTLKDWPEQAIGGKYIRLLRQQLDQLREEQPHGNRQLFLDDMFVVHLLAFFNPSVRTRRTIEDFSQTRQVHKHLSIRCICKSTLSDFHQLADPQRLEPILHGLRRQLAPKQLDVQTSGSGLHELLKISIAMDGTFLPGVAEVAWAGALGGWGEVRDERLGVRVTQVRFDRTSSVHRAIESGWNQSYFLRSS